MNKFGKRILGITLGVALVGGVGVCASFFNKESIKTDANDLKATFTSKAWADSNSLWTSNKDGNMLTSGRGVQVTTGSSGAGATTKSSYTNVTKVVFTYSTNASNGAGSISVSVGDGSSQTASITKSGGVTDRTTEVSFNPGQTGKVSFTVTCTTNSIYVKSVKVTYGESKTADGITVLDENSSEISEGDTINVSKASYTINGTVSYLTGETDHDYSPSAIESAGISFGSVGSDGDCLISFSANGSYHLTVASNVTSSVKISFTIAVNAFEEKEYKLFNGEIVAGDYILSDLSDNIATAMRNETSSDRMRYKELTVSNNSILTADSTVVWHVSAKGDYWQLFNSNVNKYAASTGAKNKIQLVDSGEDKKTLWSVSYDSENKLFEFTNKVNSDGGIINASLRYNSGYGFACYSTSTGNQLSIYRLVTPEANWAKSFLAQTATACSDPSKDNREAVAAVWPTVRTSFEALDETAKAKIADAEYSDIDLGEAVARYDMIMKKYQDSTIDNFIGRSVSSSKNIVANFDATATIAIAAVITLVSVSAIGGYFLVKKTKHE